MKKNSIKCPHCGREYLPGEIFMPKSFLGQPRNVIKHPTEGSVLAYDGDDMDTKETYICDSCNTKFSVDAIVTFKVEEVKDLFDEDDYVSEN